LASSRRSAINQNPLAALALFIRKFGERIAGGWEIFIPEEKINELGENAQIIVEPDFVRKGFKYKFFLNALIEGEGKVNDSESGLVQHPKTDDQTPA
jgi:hypothetical protein